MTYPIDTTKPAENQENPDYKQAYEELLQWIIELKPYCYTCLNNGNDDECEMCNRKMFSWVCDPSKLPTLKN